MMNPATKPRDELNEFTTQVKLCSTSIGGWDEGAYVLLRNGALVRPDFKVAEDDTCTDAFFAEGYRYCWNLDGTSVTSRDYDMMELIND